MFVRAKNRGESITTRRMRIGPALVFERLWHGLRPRWLNSKPERRQESGSLFVSCPLGREKQNVPPSPLRCAPIGLWIAIYCDKIG